MTPGINLLKKHKISHQIHEYIPESSNDSYGDEAVTKLAVAPEQVFKTLVVSLDTKELVVAVIPVSAKLSMKHIAKVVGAKKTMMADPVIVERSTGYVLGGVSPLGQKKRLKTVIDVSANNHPTICVSAGRRGLEIELSPIDLTTITSGVVAQICM